MCNVFFCWLLQNFWVKSHNRNFSNLPLNQAWISMGTVLDYFNKLLTSCQYPISVLKKNRIGNSLIEINWLILISQHECWNYFLFTEKRHYFVNKFLWDTDGEYINKKTMVLRLQFAESSRKMHTVKRRFKRNKF